MGLGVNLDYKWKPVKVNGGFVRNMMKVVVGRTGNYVLFRMATRKNGVYAALVTRYAGGKKNKKAKKDVKIVVSEEGKIKMYVQIFM